MNHPPSRTDYEARIYHTWADHFHVSPETVGCAGTTLLPDEKYAGQGVLSLWRIGAHVFVQADPGYAQQVADLLAGLPAETHLSAAVLRQAWGPTALRDEMDELVFYLFPPDLPAYAPTPPYSLRQLAHADAAAMDALHKSCTPDEVDEGFVEVTHQIAFGCLQGDALAAASSGYTRTGFMDIGVLVDPAHRRRGLARAVVGALSAWSIQAGYIPQYRCSAKNTPSRRVAESLNFNLFSQSETVWMKPLSPAPLQGR
jgi:GNAT superfamily N-acetyltransferase